MKSSSEGGWGWVVVFAGMIVYLIVFGSLRCQSVLFVPIVEEFQSEFSAVAWVSSIATAGFSIAGILAATLITKIGHRRTVMLGGLIASLGTCLASFSPSIMVLDLTAGLITGIGLGISFVPSAVIIGHYFTKRRSLALNIASIGSSIGTLSVCPINEVIISEYSLRGYFLIFGGIYLNICVAGSLMRPPPARITSPEVLEMNEVQHNYNVEEESQDIVKEEQSLKTAQGESSEENFASDIEKQKFLERKTNEDEEQPGTSQNPKIDSEDTQTQGCCAGIRRSPLWKHRPYIVYCISQVIFLAGFLCNQLYIVPYAELQVGLPRIQASLLLSIGAFVEIGSRVLFGILGDVKRIDRIWLFSGVLFVMSFFAAILPLMKSFHSMAIVIGLTGLFQGGFSGMSVVILADIVGLKNYAPALGVSTLLNGIGTLLAPPAIGWTVDKTGKPSTALFISAGILFLGAVLSAMIKVSMRYEKQNNKRQPETKE